MRSSTIKKSFALLLCMIPLAVEPSLLRAEVAAPSSDAPLSLSDIAVPEELGKVQERFTGSPATKTVKNIRTIIQIQDVHAHATAQQNIAAILERLRTVFGIEKAALEGAWVSTSLPKSHAIPTSREKQLLAGTLLEDDRISGPVYAAIMSPEPITLIGIEDETSYEKNRTLFLAHLGKVSEIDEKLRTYGVSLQALQGSTWGPELLAFGNAFGKYRENSDLGKFFPVLLKAAEAQGADLSNLTQIALLRDIMALEKSFEKERLEKEVRQVIKKYKNTPWTLEELIRGGKIPVAEIGLYPEIKKLTQLYKMRDEVSLKDLTDQIGALTRRILEKLVKTPEERTLWEKTGRFYLSKKLLLLQAAPADLEAYEGEKFLLESELTGAGLLEVLALSVDFYDTVKKRDEIFFDKIMTDPALAGDIAVVTGGFHTDGLSRRFRDAGVSYITVTPELGGTAMNEKIYNARMAEGGGRMETNSKPETPSSILHPPSAAQSATLSELRNALSWIDERFLEALKVLFQKKNVLEAANVFEGKKVAVSKAEKIARLVSKKRLRKNVGPNLVDVSEFRVQEFMALPRSSQLEALRGLLDRARESSQKTMVVITQSGVQNIERQLLGGTRSGLLAQTLANGDIFAVLQNTEEIPEILLGKRAVRRFPVKTVSELLVAKGFPSLRRTHPTFVIIQNGYRGDFVALQEQSDSLLLYRIIALNPSLYQAARNPAFLVLLQDIIADILSQELPKTSV